MPVPARRGCAPGKTETRTAQLSGRLLRAGRRAGAERPCARVPLEPPATLSRRPGAAGGRRRESPRAARGHPLGGCSCRARLCQPSARSHSSSVWRWISGYCRRKPATSAGARGLLHRRGPGRDAHGQARAAQQARRDDHPRGPGAPRESNPRARLDRRRPTAQQTAPSPLPPGRPSVRAAARRTGRRTTKLRESPRGAPR
jgi:hypothetical protein